jgi:hypothetical protein
MKLLKRYKQIKESLMSKESLIEDLGDISCELTDNKDFKFNSEIYENFVLVNITPDRKEYIDNSLIDTIKRMVYCAYNQSFDLGSNKWYDGLQDKLRVKRKVSSAYYVISIKELDEFIDIDFSIIELVFYPII